MTKANEGKAARVKFGNVRKQVDGIWFDSIKEAEYYGKLKLLIRAGLVVKIEIHKVYPLSFNGVHICNYEADFVLYMPDGSVKVQDVKSAATEGLPVFIIKTALMLAVFGIKVEIVK